MTKNTDFETVGAMHQCKKGEMFSTCAHCGAMAEKLNSPCPQYMRNAAAAMTKAAPVAPAPQPAPMPYPTDAQVDAVYEQTMGQHLRSQDAPAVRRFGRAMFLCAWNAADPKAAPVTDAEQAAWFAGPDEGRSQARALLQQGEYLPLPTYTIAHPNGTTETKTQTIFSISDMHAYVDADRAARGAAQAAPADVAEDAEDGARSRAMVNAAFTGFEVFERVMYAASETEPETIDDLRALVDKARAQVAQAEGGA